MNTELDDELRAGLGLQPYMSSQRYERILALIEQKTQQAHREGYKQGWDSAGGEFGEEALKQARIEELELAKSRSLVRGNQAGPSYYAIDPDYYEDRHNGTAATPGYEPIEEPFDHWIGQDGSVNLQYKPNQSKKEEE